MAESLWICPFKAHKNEPIEDIPTSYLEWLTEQDWFLEKYPTGADRIGQELAFRTRFGEGDEPEEDQAWNRRK